jgi:hypothetical protein
MLAATCYFDGCHQSSRIHVHPVRLLLKLGLELVGKRRKKERGGEGRGTENAFLVFFPSKINSVKEKSSLFLPSSDCISLI